MNTSQPSWICIRTKTKQGVCTDVSWTSLFSICGPLRYPSSLLSGLIQTHGFEYHLCVNDSQIDTFNPNLFLNLYIQLLCSPFPLGRLIGDAHLVRLQWTLGPSNLSLPLRLSYLIAFQWFPTLHTWNDCDPVHLPLHWIHPTSSHLHLQTCPESNYFSPSFLTARYHIFMIYVYHLSPPQACKVPEGKALSLITTKFQCPGQWLTQSRNPINIFTMNDLQ